MRLLKPLEVKLKEKFKGIAVCCVLELGEIRELFDEV